MTKEYAIFKMYPKKEGCPQYLEGPFFSKRKAMEVFKKEYELPGVLSKNQVFAVVKIIYERVL